MGVDEARRGGAWGAGSGSSRRRHASYGGGGGVREQGSRRDVGAMLPGWLGRGLAGCWAGPVGVVLFFL